MNPLLVKIIMISLIVRANTSHGAVFTLWLPLSLCKLAIIHHAALCASACVLLGLHKWRMYVLKSSLSVCWTHTRVHILMCYWSGAGSEAGCEKEDKDTGEETVTRRAALPDQYTNTNADTVIDKPLLTTEGRKLSTIIGWNVSQSCQCCARVSRQISSGSAWKMESGSLGSFTWVTQSASSETVA